MEWIASNYFYHFFTFANSMEPCGTPRHSMSRQASDYLPLIFQCTVEPVNSDHMSVNRGGRYIQVVPQYRTNVMLEAPAGAFSITFDLYKAIHIIKSCISMVAPNRFHCMYPFDKRSMFKSVRIGMDRNGSDRIGIGKMSI